MLGTNGHESAYSATFTNADGSQVRYPTVTIKIHGKDYAIYQKNDGTRNLEAIINQGTSTTDIINGVSFDYQKNAEQIKVDDYYYYKGTTSDSANYFSNAMVYEKGNILTGINATDILFSKNTPYLNLEKNKYVFGQCSYGKSFAFKNYNISFSNIEDLKPNDKMIFLNNTGDIRHISNSFKLTLNKELSNNTVFNIDNINSIEGTTNSLDLIINKIKINNINLNSWNGNNLIIPQGWIVENSYLALSDGMGIKKGQNFVSYNTLKMVLYQPFRQKMGYSVDAKTLMASIDDYISKNFKVYKNMTIDTGNFLLPDLKGNEHIYIFAPRTENTSSITDTSNSNYFDDDSITGERKYKETIISNDTVNGITFNGKNHGGVKTTDNGTSLSYFADTNDISAISLNSSTMGTPRNLDKTYSFANLKSIDATKLSFYNPQNINGTFALLNSENGFIKEFSITGANHTQYFDIETNGLKMSATLSGTVKATDTGLDYVTKDNSVNSLDLSNWNGKTSEVEDNLNLKNISVSLEQAKTDKVSLGEKQTILTSSAEGTFDKITGEGAYKEEKITKDSDKGVSFDGTHFQGIKVEDKGKKLDYYAKTDSINNISLNNVTFGENRNTKDTVYDFRNVKTIDISNLQFSNAKDVKGTFKILSNAYNLADELAVSSSQKGLLGGTSNHSQNFDYLAENGITLNSTLKGTILTKDSSIQYETDGTYINSINLANWNGKNTDIKDWTGSNVSVTASDFDIPNLKVGEHQDILTTSQKGFFGNISGDLAYTEKEITNDSSNGISFSGKYYKGVKANDTNSVLSYYAETKDIYNVDLSEMTWGVGRTDTNGYDFRNAVINTSKFNLKDAENATSEMTIFSGENISKNQIIKDNTKTQTFSFNQGGAVLNATIYGSIFAEDGYIGYRRNWTKFNSLDLSNYDGKTVLSMPTDWIRNESLLKGMTVNTGEMSEPSDVEYGGTKDILTMETEGFFDDNDITGENKYQTHEVSVNENGVNFSGTQDKGYHSADNGKKLVYEKGKVNVDQADVGEIDLNNSTITLENNKYSFDENTVVDASDLSFNGTRTDNPLGTSITIIDGISGISDNNIVQPTNASVDISHNLDSGINIEATGTGSLSNTNNKLQYDIDAVEVNKVHLDNWNGTTSTVPTNWTGENVAVETGDFTKPNDVSIGQSKDVLVSDNEGFFGSVTGNHAYSSDTINNETINGVGFTGSHYGGVKTEENGKKLTYYAETSNVNEITLGGMTWGVGRTASDLDLFSNVNSINASNLTFSNAEEATGSMNLLSSANGLPYGKTITGANHSQDFSFDKGGAVFNATLTGTIASKTNSIEYTRTGTTLHSVDISGWDGTTNLNVPSDWSKDTTSSHGVEINTANMETPPNVSNNQSVDIISTDIEGMFSDNDITGDEKYQTRDLTNEKENGINFVGKQDKGVKASEDGKKLIYKADEKKVERITLSDFNETEGTRNTSAGYNFSNATNIDATNLSFKEPDNIDTSVTILDGANGLSNNTHIDGANHTQEYNKNLDNGIVLDASLHGTVEAKEEKIIYTPANKTLDKVETKKWNGENSTTLTENLSKSNFTVDTTDTKEPTSLNDGESRDIITGSEKIFDDKNITGNKKYQSYEIVDYPETVSLSGHQNKGIHASEDGKKLVYSKDKVEIEKIGIYEFEWDKPVTVNNNYDYSNAFINSNNVSFLNPQDIAPETSTTILKANDTLASISQEVKNNYQYTPVSGVNIEAELIGRFISSGDTLSYTAKENHASNLVFGDVAWNETAPLIDHNVLMKNVSFNNANIDTSNINFVNVGSLNTNQKMTLVKSFGDKAGEIKGTKFKVGSTLEGEGHASLVGKDIVFSIDKGTTVQNQTHNTLMGASAGVVAINSGNNNISQAMDSIANSGYTGSDGISAFGTVGTSNIRQETGSYVDVNSWNAIVTLGKENKKQTTTTKYGVFVEYGKGSYSVYNGEHTGNGESTYQGGGLLLKHENKAKTYIEGTLRLGTVRDKTTNILQDTYGNSFGYDETTPYYGFSIGVGQKIDLNKNSSLDVFGKYNYLYKKGISYNAGGEYDIDSMSSQVLSLGAIYQFKRDKWNYYAGLTYEYEMDGKVTGRADNMDIRPVDISGGTFKVDIGATVEINENWNLNFNFAELAGKRQGHSISGKIEYNF